LRHHLTPDEFSVYDYDGLDGDQSRNIFPDDQSLFYMDSFFSQLNSPEKLNMSPMAYLALHYAPSRQPGIRNMFSA
jgi:hypothetical protein